MIGERTDPADREDSIWKQTILTREQTAMTRDKS